MSNIEPTRVMGVGGSGQDRTLVAPAGGPMGRPEGSPVRGTSWNCAQLDLHSQWDLSG